MGVQMMFSDLMEQSAETKIFQQMTKEEQENVVNLLADLISRAAAKQSLPEPEQEVTDHE